MRHSVGDRLYFLGYRHLLPDMQPILYRGQLVVAASVRTDGELVCFPIDYWGRVYSWQGETVFDEEVLRIPLPRIPVRRLPPPYGQGEVNEINWRLGCS